MVATLKRPTPSSDTNREYKKYKTYESKDTESCFDASIFVEADMLKKNYHLSKPYKHAVIEKLVQEELLLSVKDECIKELCFTEKETDIYKVRSLNREKKEKLIPITRIGPSNW